MFPGRCDRDSEQLVSKKLGLSLSSLSGIINKKDEWIEPFASCIRAQEVLQVFCIITDGNEGLHAESKI